ncbi:hypothetical protein TNCV_4140501 [Trichonephila clavipes]|nr:hypothetical protein TNCV_4140501 [Trichonephila clavipes]
MAGIFVACFLMKGSAWVPVMDMCWSKGGQKNACNQSVCILDKLDLHLESSSGEQYSTTAGAVSWLSQTQ